DLAAARQHLLLVALEVPVEVGEGVILDVAGDVAQLLELRQGGRRLAPPLLESVPQILHGPLQAGVVEGALGVLLERVRGGLHRRYFRSGLPIGGRSAMSASTSATCRTATGT